MKNKNDVNDELFKSAISTFEIEGKKSNCFKHVSCIEIRNLNDVHSLKFAKCCTIRRKDSRVIDRLCYIWISNKFSHKYKQTFKLRNGKHVQHVSESLAGFSLFRFFSLYIPVSFQFINLCKFI